MSRIVILTDEEVEILLSYHKQRIAVVDEQIQHLSEKKSLSEHRLQELVTANEVVTEADAQEAEHEEETSPVAAEAEHTEAAPVVEETETTEGQEAGHEEEAPVAEETETTEEPAEVVAEASQAEFEDQEAIASIEEPSAENGEEQAQEENTEITAETEANEHHEAPASEEHSEESTIHTPNKGVYTA